MLKRGDHVVVAVAGFAAGAPVQLRLAGGPDDPGSQPGLPTLVADDAGRVRLVYSIPLDSSTGRHLLALSGPGSSTVVAPNATSDNTVTITATVPNIRLFHYLVAS